MTGKLPEIDYSSHPAYGGTLNPHPGIGDRALRVLRPVIEEMTATEQERTQQFGYRHGYADAIGQELVSEGMSRAQLEAAATERIHQAALPVIDLVRERLLAAREAGEPIKYKTALEAISQEQHADLRSAIDRAMRDAGIYGITAAFFGAPSAKLHSAGLLVNAPDQDWATRLYRDVDIETPPTAGFHIDSNGKCFVKAVLYLSDVGPDQGPFGMIPGSHRWGEGSQDRIFRRAFDKSGLVVRSAKKRRMFISLPPEMQVKAEFGGDMIAGTPEADDLLQRERVSTGPRGQVNLFDPEAIHRGGNVRHGERIAVLVTTRPLW